MFIKSFVIISFLFLLSLYGYGSAENLDWPEHIRTAIWVPKEAKNIEHKNNGSYQTLYSLEICYPAKNLIDDMVKQMTAKGWTRLDLDPLNPSKKVILNHNRGPWGEWGFGVDQDMSEGYDWRDFWMDREKNIIEYRFSYTIKPKQNIRNTCSLRGLIIYSPVDFIKLLIKSFGDMPLREPRAGE